MSDPNNPIIGPLRDMNTTRPLEDCPGCAELRRRLEALESAGQRWYEQNIRLARLKHDHPKGSGEVLVEDMRSVALQTQLEDVIMAPTRPT